MSMLRIGSAAAAALMVVTGCADRAELPLTPAATPQFAISDGARGGNAHFFFLPPMVPQPKYQGTFNGALTPVVDICEWTGDACILPLVAEFTTTTGPGGETVRVVDQYYLVYWRTDQFALDPAKSYRIRVLVAGTELGHADVAVLQTGKDLKNNDTGENVALVNGRALPIRFRIEDGAVSVIGPAGGTVTAGAGQVQLVVPPGALAADAGIVIAPVAAPDIPPGRGLIPGTVWDFQPTGLAFLQPAQLTLAYAEANLPAGLPETALTLLSETAGVWDELAGAASNPAANVITGPISGFSRKGGAAAAVVTVSPTTATLDVGATQQFTPTVADAVGNPLIRPVRWTSGDVAVATVDNAGLATAVAPGDVTITVRAGQAAADAAVTVRIPFPAAIVAGGAHSCALAGGLTYCWGYNFYGQLGDGSTTDRLTPVLVSGGPVFQSLSGGAFHTCGITAAGDAYCWGLNNQGQLGDGSVTNKLTPVPVSGGHNFLSISAGPQHTCGVTTTEEAYCWGANFSGQLGDGSTTGRLTPVLVSGGHTFQSVSLGFGQFTCGISSGDGYCWGTNLWGNLGDGSTIARTAPVLVSGSHVFQSIALGASHTCGVTSSHEGYCWGQNISGKLGDGTQMNPQPTPVPVSGGHSFQSVTVGAQFSCAVTTTGDAYCWGENTVGQLGDGSQITRFTPVLVSGGLSFQTITALGSHTCGATSAGDGYCWGANGNGQVGVGNRFLQFVPAFVIDLTP